MTWASDYVTGDEFSDYLSKGAIDFAEDYVDADASRVVTAASRIVDGHCRRQFGLVAAPEARRYEIERRGHTSAHVAIDDLMTSVGLVVTIGGVVQETPADGWDLWPSNAPQKGTPWTRLRIDGWVDCGTATITARWGWTTVPEGVKAATLLQAARLLIRRDSPYGIAGSLDVGSELRLLARVDPDVAVALAPYRRAVSPR